MIRSLSRPLALALPLALAACGSSAPEPAEKPPEPAVAAPSGPVPTLLVAQAQFITKNGRPAPGPAKLVLVRKVGDTWQEEVVEDPGSNVFHKAMPWRDGILTIGAEAAKLVHWTRGEAGWTGETLFEAEFGGKFDRLRDIEIGDVDGDGADELVIATHDMGELVVGDEGDGGWAFQRFARKADTFVHEIEIGDVDGDGTDEFYATPSDRNKASLESQPGGVVRVDFRDGAYVVSPVIHWTESHAKEILVADVDGDGTDELYAVREGHTRKNDAGKTELLDPVRIVKLTRGADGAAWDEETVATVDDHQMRFLVPGDLNGDGRTDLLAAAFKTGLYALVQDAEGGFERQVVDASSSGFEHATHVADLDGDGALEIYVASDDQGELRRYTWTDGGFSRERIGTIPKQHLTWNIQDGTF